MRFILLIGILYCLYLQDAQAQYTVNRYFDANKNPQNLNQDFERINSDYQVLFPLWQSPREIYFPFRNLPFPFVFYGDTVSRYRVSNSGFVSFAPGPLAPSIPGRLPSSSMSDKTIAIWGIKQQGGNDAIYAKTFGIPPYRQHWIYFHSFSDANSSVNGDANWSVVLCETTNIVYIVDMGSYQTPLNLTLGLQDDSLNATEVRGSPYLSSHIPSGIDSYTSTDNSYYEFIPGSRKNTDLDLAEISIPSHLKIGQAFSFDLKFRDLSANKKDTVCISYQIGQQSAIYTDTIFIPNSNNSFYNISSPTSLWVPSGPERKVNLKYWIHDGNGTVDQNPSNDTLHKEVYLIPYNRWPKRYLLESHESAILAYGVESKLNMNYVQTQTQSIIPIAWHNDSLFIDSMRVRGSNRIGNYFNVLYPEGTFDRSFMPSTNSINQPPEKWFEIADSLPLASSPLNVEVFGVDQGTQIALNVKATFTDAVPREKRRITVVLIEDSVTGFGSGFNQVNTFNGQFSHPFWNYGNPIVNYAHRRVVRAVFPSNDVWGLEGLIEDQPTLDSAYTLNGQINLSPWWDKSKMSLVAFVTNHDSTGSNRTVINAAEVKLSDLLTSLDSPESPITEKPKLFPNPAVNRITVDLGNKGEDFKRLKIINPKGQIVHQQLISGNRIQIQLEGDLFESGVYFMQLEGINKSIVEKFLLLP